ncbi:hypothetical protein GOV11_03390 [Candidatus Woesearchaeota archaeon]|nr:hypothetical protein [Candidatus Woesearchaeota archaeon]
MKHKREAVMTAGILLILIGIASFLIPIIQHYMTFIFLIAGAAATIYSVWFWK